MLGEIVGSLHCILSWWHICVWYIYSNNKFWHSGVKSRYIKKDNYRSCWVLGDASRMLNIAVRETNSALRLVAHILCRTQEPENTIKYLTLLIHLRHWKKYHWENLRHFSLLPTYQQWSTYPKQRQQFWQTWCCHKQSPQQLLAILHHFCNSEQIKSISQKKSKRYINDCLTWKTMTYSLNDCLKDNLNSRVLLGLTCTKGQWRTWYDQTQPLCTPCHLRPWVGLATHTW